MFKKVEYKIYKEHKLLIEVYSGSIDISDIKRNKQKSLTDEEYSPSFNIVLDFRDAHIENKSNEISLLFDFLKSNPILQSKKKVAYLTSKPNEVVLTTLFKMELKDLSIPINGATFYTTKSALYWLGIDNLTENKLNCLIEELKT